MDIKYQDLHSKVTNSVKWLKSWMKSEERAKTHFDKLSNEMVLSILDQMDFPELLSIAEVDDRLAVLASDAFRRKRFTVEFDPFEMYMYRSSRISSMLEMANLIELMDDTDSSFIPYTCSDTRIVIKEEKFALQMLKLFGMSIEKIKIRYGMNIPPIFDAIKKFISRTNIEKIGKMINEYCDETLMSIEFRDIHYNSLKYMPNPFQQVTQVKFVGSVPQHNKQKLSMNELFPALRRLSLEDIPDINEYLLDTFPHLEHLSLKVHYGNKTLGRLMDLNPQIQSVKMHYPGSHYLEFLENNRNISRFEILYFQLKESELERLMALLPNVKEMTLDSYTAEGINVDAIAKSLHNHEHLMTLILKCICNLEGEIFRQKFNGSGWKMIDQNSNRRILLQRDSSLN